MINDESDRSSTSVRQQPYALTDLYSKGWTIAGNSKEQRLHQNQLRILWCRTFSHTNVRLGCESLVQTQAP